MSQKGLLGAAGASKGLEEYLSRRMEEQQIAEQERATRAREAEIARASQVQEAYLQNKMAIDEAIRKDTLEANTAYRNQIIKDKERDDIRAESEQAHKKPIGTEVEPERYQYETGTLKIDPGMYQKTPGKYLGMAGDDASEPLTGPERIVWRGREADDLKRDQLAEKERAARDVQAGQDRRTTENNQTNILIEMLRGQNAMNRAALGGSNDARVMKIRDEDGVDRDVMVDLNGRVVFDARSQLPAGMKGKEASLQTLTGSIDQILQVGQATKWKGTGQFDARLGAAQAAFNKGDPAQVMFRSMIDSIQADVAHEKYGSAFTATERAMLSQFAPKSTDSDFNIEYKLKAMQWMINARLQELSSGKKLPQTTPLALLMNQVGGRRAGGVPMRNAVPVQPQGPPTPPAGGGFKVKSARPVGGK